MASPLTLTRLRLTDFRNWASVTAEFAAGPVAIVGENGAGKTNLLEAISLLGPGRGLRGARVAELGRRDPARGVASWATAGRFLGPDGAFDLGTGTSEGEAVAGRIFRLDGERVRSAASLAERVATVWITPQMDRLLAGEAAERRRFLDRLVWALQPQHAQQVAAYERALAGRRRLLRTERRPEAAWLSALEDAMARHGTAVAAARRDVVARLGAVLAASPGGAAAAFPTARLRLECPVATALDARPALEVEDGLRAGWAASRALDAVAGTRAGTHRADLLVEHASRGVPASGCSTGEQKALLIAIVLAHAALMAADRGFAPILLLDEVAAHLDPVRRAALFAALAMLPGQAFLTGTEAATFGPLTGRVQGLLAGDGALRPIAL